MFLNKLFLYWKKVFTFNNFSSSSNLQFSNFSQIYLIINQIYLNYCPEIIESRKEYIVSFINENFNRHLAQKNLNLRNFLQLSKQLDCYCSFFIFQKFPLFLHWPAKFANKDRNFSFTVRFSFLSYRRYFNKRLLPSGCTKLPARGTRDVYQRILHQNFQLIAKLSQYPAMKFQMYPACRLFRTSGVQQTELLTTNQGCSLNENEPMLVVHAWSVQTIFKLSSLWGIIFHLLSKHSKNYS